jgi:hypothetical protein
MSLMQRGFTRLYDSVADQILELQTPESYTRDNFDNVYALVDRLSVRSDSLNRLVDSIETCFTEGHGQAVIQTVGEDAAKLSFSEKFECKKCGLGYIRPEPRLFSFNNPRGACQTCNGLGTLDFEEVEREVSSYGGPGEGRKNMTTTSYYFKNKKVQESDDDEEDDDVDEKPKKKAAGKKDAKGSGKGAVKSAGKDGKPGIIESILEFVKAGTKEKGVKKDAIHDKLVKRFKDRNSESMWTTVNLQVPNKLRTDKGVNIQKADNGGYYIAAGKAKAATKVKAKEEPPAKKKAKK